MIFIGIHLWGVGEALRFSLVVTAIAVAALLVFAVGALHRLRTSTRSTTSRSTPAPSASSSWLPFGVLGIWAAFPFGMWFFLGVEGVPLAAEETKRPGPLRCRRPWPWSMGILLVLALLTFLAATGARGSAAIQDGGQPAGRGAAAGRRGHDAQPRSSTTRAWPAWSPPSSP